MIEDLVDGDPAIGVVDQRAVHQVQEVADLLIDQLRIAQCLEFFEVQNRLPLLGLEFGELLVEEGQLEHALVVWSEYLRLSGSPESP